LQAREDVEDLVLIIAPVGDIDGFGLLTRAA